MSADGRIIQPDFAIVDDPSTGEAATSPTQNAKRERLHSGAVLGLAGLTEKDIAGRIRCEPLDAHTADARGGGAGGN